MLPEITVNWLWLNSWESGHEIYVCLFWLPFLRGLATIQRTEIIWVDWVPQIPTSRIACILQLDTLSYKWWNCVSLVTEAIKTLSRDNLVSTIRQVIYFIIYLQLHWRSIFQSSFTYATKCVSDDTILIVLCVFMKYENKLQIIPLFLSLMS